MSESTKCSECGLHTVVGNECDCLFCRLVAKDFWDKREQNAHKWHKEICIEGKNVRCEYFRASATI